MFMHAVDRGGGGISVCLCVWQGLPAAFFWQQQHTGAAGSFFRRLISNLT